MLNIPSKQGSAGDAGPAGRLGIFAGLSLFVAHFSLLWMLRAKRICKVLRKPGLFNKLSLSSSVHISSPDIKNKHKPWVTIYELDHMVASEIHFVFSFPCKLKIICFVFLVTSLPRCQAKRQRAGSCVLCSLSPASWSAAWRHLLWRHKSPNEEKVTELTTFKDFLQDFGSAAKPGWGRGRGAWHSY